MINTHAKGPVGPRETHERILCNSPASARSFLVSMTVSERPSMSGTADNAEGLQQTSFSGIGCAPVFSFPKKEIVMSFPLEGAVEGKVGHKTELAGSEHMRPLNDCLTCSKDGGSIALAKPRSTTFPK